MKHVSTASATATAMATPPTPPPPAPPATAPLTSGTAPPPTPKATAPAPIAWLIAAVTRPPVRRAGRIAATAYRVLAITLLLAGTLGVVIVLVARNFSSTQPAWAVEGYTLALVTGGMLFVGDVVRHIGFGGVPPLIRAVPWLAVLVQTAFSLFVYYVLLTQGIEAAHRFYDSGTHTPSGAIPLWLIYVAVPLVGIRGLTTTLTQLVVQLWPGSVQR
jgi:TRAP-type C4-dicarboxylate transport system permease small subunit